MEVFSQNEVILPFLSYFYGCCFRLNRIDARLLFNFHMLFYYLIAFFPPNWLNPLTLFKQSKFVPSHQWLAMKKLYVQHFSTNGFIIQRLKNAKHSYTVVVVAIRTTLEPKKNVKSSASAKQMEIDFVCKNLNVHKEIIKVMWNEHYIAIAIWIFCEQTSKEIIKKCIWIVHLYTKEGKYLNLNEQFHLLK